LSFAISTGTPGPHQKLVQAATRQGKVSLTPRSVERAHRHVGA
jgi:hypothetical protein